MKKQEFIELTGEDPVDVLGQDWENEIENFATPSTEEEDIGIGPNSVGEYLVGPDKLDKGGEE